MTQAISWTTRWRGVLAWGIAGLSAACAAWAAQRYLDDQAEQARTALRGGMVERLVADRPLDAGMELALAYLAVRQVPAAWAASHGLVPGDAARAQGKRLAWPLRAGEVLTEMHLAAPEPARLAERLTPGRRALTITVSQASSQSGLLQPGDRIDLFVALPRDGRKATTSLLQDVVVLATGNAMEGAVAGGGGRSFRTVTLDVSLDDALLLLAAREEGEMVAVLRASGDSGAGLPRRSVSLDQLLGLHELPSTPAPIAVLYGNRRMERVPPLEVGPGMVENELAVESE